MVIINGKVYSGNNLTITNNKVIIDGKVIDDGNTKEINITVNSDIQNIKVDTCSSFNMTGNAGTVVTASGDVRISGSVNGSVTTVSGDVRCKSIAGSVSTISGDVG